MEVKELSNYQLYALIQNHKLDPSIRNLANSEFDSRKLTIEQIGEIVNRHDAQFKPDKDEGLSLAYKIFLVLFPAVLTIQVLIAGRDLANNRRKKWKDFWLFVSLGYLFWTIAIIFIVRLTRR
jgi:hypothetical protein